MITVSYTVRDGCFAVVVRTPTDLVQTAWLIAGGAPHRVAPHACRRIAEQAAAHNAQHFGLAPDGTYMVGSVSELVAADCTEIVGPTPRLPGT